MSKCIIALYSPINERRSVIQSEYQKNCRRRDMLQFDQEDAENKLLIAKIRVLGLIYLLTLHLLETRIEFTISN